MPHQYAAMELVMKNSPQKKPNGSASVDEAPSTDAPADTTPFDQEEVKRNLDCAWEKFQHALHQEAEGNDQWIESTLELSKILYDARQRLPPDQAFGEWLTKSGYGEERITRNDRQALQNMALNLAVTREVRANASPVLAAYLGTRNSTPVAQPCATARWQGA
jgi:hypothetical protein